jgi:hypothetical protein
MIFIALALSPSDLRILYVFDLISRVIRRGFGVWEVSWMYLEFSSDTAPTSSRNPSKSWCKDQSGIAAIEFSIVAMPFAMMLFGIISVFVYFFTDFMFENAVWQASREMRTGQYQTGSGQYQGLSGDTLKEA